MRKKQTAVEERALYDAIKSYDTFKRMFKVEYYLSNYLYNKEGEYPYNLDASGFLLDNLEEFAEIGINSELDSESIRIINDYLNKDNVRCFCDLLYTHISIPFNLADKIHSLEAIYTGCLLSDNTEIGNALIHFIKTWLDGYYLIVVSKAYKSYSHIYLNLQISNDDGLEYDLKKLR